MMKGSCKDRGGGIVSEGERVQWKIGQRTSDAKNVCHYLGDVKPVDRERPADTGDAVDPRDHQRDCSR